MDSKIGFEMNLIVVEAIRGRCAEFHGSNCNGVGDILWTDKPIYFSSIYVGCQNKYELTANITENRQYWKMMIKTGPQRYGL